MQPINFPLELKQLENKMFSTQELRDFVDKVGTTLILQKFQSGVKGTKKLVEKILSDTKIYDQVLLPKKAQDFQILIDLYHAKQDFKAVLACALEEQYRGVAKILNTLFSENKDQFLHQISMFFAFVDEEDSAVGLKACKSISKMLNKELLNCIESEEVYALLEKGIGGENDVVRMRYMEIIMEFSNTSEISHNILVQKGLLDKCFQQIKTDDILLRLSAVEIISKIGNKQYNSKFLSSHKIMKTIIDDAFNPLEELYVKKYMALLISKLVSNGTLEFDVDLKQNFLSLIIQLFMTGLEEEKYASMDIISQLALTQAGIEVVITAKEIFAQYMAISLSTKQHVKQRFIASFSSFFYKNPFDSEQKDVKILQNLIALFGAPEKIKDIVDFKQTTPQFVNLQPVMDHIFKLLYEPFQEIELEMIFFIKNIIQWESICKWFIGHSKCINYFSEHLAKNGEIYEEKSKLVELLKHLCNDVFKKDNTEFKSFITKLLSTIELKKKLMDQDGQKKMDEMEYGLANM